MVLEEGRIAVFRGDPGEADRHVGPVYALDPGGSLVVPTGRILVRFAAATRAEDRRRDLARAGFEIEEVLAYAPQAAWVRPARGGVPEALHGIAALEALPGVEHVEPQMLRRSAGRAPRGRAL